MSFKIFFLSNFVRSKEFPGITSKTVISINHSCSLGFSKTAGVGEGNTAGFCIKQFVRFRKKHCLININLTFYNFLKTFVSRIKISSHFSPRFGFYNQPSSVNSVVLYSFTYLHYSTFLIFFFIKTRAALCTFHALQKKQELLFPH